MAFFIVNQCKGTILYAPKIYSKRNLFSPLLRVITNNDISALFIVGDASLKHQQWREKLKLSISVNLYNLPILL